MTQIPWSKTFERQFKRKPQRDQHQVLRSIGELVRNENYPGLRRHRIHGADEVLWAIRAGRRLRVVYVEQDDGHWILANCCTHDQAYRP